MSSREELLGAQVLQLVDRFHHKADESHTPKRHPLHLAHHPLRAAALTALEALALMSLAHRLEGRTRRLASVAGTAYLKHRMDAHDTGHH